MATLVGLGGRALFEADVLVDHRYGSRRPREPPNDFTIVLRDESDHQTGDRNLDCASTQHSTALEGASTQHSTALEGGFAESGSEGSEAPDPSPGTGTLAASYWSGH